MTTNLRSHSYDRPRTGVGLPVDVRERLVRALERYGIKRLANAAEVSENTIFRAIAGGGLYGGSRVALEVGVERLEAEAP